MPAAAQEKSMQEGPEESGQKPKWSTQKKILVLRGSVAGLIVGNALLNWVRLNKPDFSFSDDGWFEQSAPNAGADKTGHAFSSYVISRAFSAIYRNFGLQNASADWQGPLSAWGTMFLVEMHDVFQGYGFSYKDIVANSTGAALAFLEERYDAINDLIDYRIEYVPSEGFLKSGETDFLTDYPGMKHLLVLKPSGIKALGSNPLSWLEFHAGFFTKGTAYAVFAGETEKSRHLYAGVSLNFSGFFDKAARRSERFKKPLHITSVFLEYYQPPYVSLDAVDKLD